MPMIAAGAAVAGPVIGGIIGGVSASAGRKAQAAAAAAAYAELQKIGMPPDLSKEVILRQFQSAGTLTPELQQDIEMQASQVAQISEDPSLKSAQMDALNTLGQVSRGGLQAGDRAAYNELRNKVQQDSEAKRQQILQQMQARGMGGSGANLAAQLQQSQASADTASQGADALAATASQNALAALNQRAALAGSVRNQDLTAAQMKAKAIDDRNQFLYQNSVARQASNVNAQNSAQAANLQNAQAISNANTGQANTESLRENEAQRQNWQDQLALAQSKANALNNQGSIAQQGAQAQANMYAGLGAALGQGAAAYGNYATAQAKTAATPATTTNIYGATYNPDGTRAT